MTMTDDDAQDVIADTTYTVVLGGEERSVEVSLSRPRPTPEGDWACKHRVSAIESVPAEVGDAIGIDSLQALCLSIEMLRARLLLLERRLGARLQGWDGVSIGLPVLNTRYNMPKDLTTDEGNKPL